MVKVKCYQEALFSTEAGYLRPRPADHLPEHGRNGAGKGPPRSHSPRHSKTLELCKWVGVPLGVSVCFAFSFATLRMRVTWLLRTRILLIQRAAKGRSRPFSGREGRGSHSSLKRKKAQPSPLSTAQPRSPGPWRGTSG